MRRPSVDRRTKQGSTQANYDALLGALKEMVDRFYPYKGHWDTSEGRRIRYIIKKAEGK